MSQLSEESFCRILEERQKEGGYGSVCRPSEELFYRFLLERHREDAGILPARSPYQPRLDTYDYKDWRRPIERRAVTARGVLDLALGKKEETWLWWHEGLCVRAGLERPELERALERGGVPTVEALPLVLLREGYGVQNPWRRGVEWNLIKDAPASGGFRCEEWLYQWERWITEPHKQEEPLPLSPGGEGQARDLLREVLARPLSLSPAEASRAFRLRIAAQSPLIAFERRGEHVALHAVALMGAGRLLRYAAVRFPGEQPMPGLWLDGAYDFGDLRLWEFTSRDEVLDGTCSAAVQRRRGEEAVAQADDDDDGGGPGDAGWPSTTGNPSGGGRRNGYLTA